MQFEVQPSAIGSAKVTVPGDKSISHRALMLGAIADGTTNISGFLDGEDCLATLAAMQAMGVGISRSGDSEVTVSGVGLDGLQRPVDVLDLGNSGTAIRLLAGLLAGQAFDTTLTGDASLSSRPMKRIIVPLERMGAKISSNESKPPLLIEGAGGLTGIHYELPMASAQVKSAILIAGLYADRETSVTEPAVTRDHTERMMRTMGVAVTTTGGRIGLLGGQSLKGTHVQVPADLSSAAFVMLAALLANKADVLIRNVGVNPTRTGVIDILQAMGADIALENGQLLGEEPVADIRVRSSRLKGGPVDPALVSLAIDEFPVLFIAAAAANGKTVFSGLGELRVKESDRIATMVQGLRTLGIDVDETDDGAVVHGGRMTGGTVASHGDHRIGMSFAIAGGAADDAVTVLDVDAVDTSFPGFAKILNSIGSEIRAESGPSQ